MLTPCRKEFGGHQRCERISVIVPFGLRQVQDIFYAERRKRVKACRIDQSGFYFLYEMCRLFCKRSVRLFLRFCCHHKFSCTDKCLHKYNHFELAELWHQWTDFTCKLTKLNSKLGFTQWYAYVSHLVIE
jgi:hypothetical protein